MADNNQTPTTAEEFFDRAGVRYAAGDLDGAISDLNEAIRLQPDFAEAWGNRGSAKSEKGDHDGAIADLNEAIRMQPNLAVAWDNRGSAKNRQGDHDGAIADLNEGIRLRPDVAEAWGNRGNAKLAKGDHDGAIADYNEVIRLRPGDAIAWSNRGSAKSRKGDLDGAIADYDEAIHFDKNCMEAVHNRAVALTLKSLEQYSEEEQVKGEKEEADAASDRVRADMENVRKLHQEKLEECKKYEKRQDRLPLFAGGLLVFLTGMSYVAGIGLLPLPYVLGVAPVATLFLVWWGRTLRTRHLQAQARADELHRKIIVDERTFASEDPKMQTQFVTHWVQRTSAEEGFITSDKNFPPLGDLPK